MTTPDPLAFLAKVGGPRPPAPRSLLARSARLAMRIDTQLSSSGAVIAFGTPTIGELASPRLGCRHKAPLSYGDDLAQLCPRPTTP